MYQQRLGENCCISIFLLLLYDCFARLFSFNRARLNVPLYRKLKIYMLIYVVTSLHIVKNILHFGIIVYFYSRYCFYIAYLVFLIFSHLLPHPYLPYVCSYGFLLTSFFIKNKMKVIMRFHLHLKVVKHFGFRLFLKSLEYLAAKIWCCIC